MSNAIYKQYIPIGKDKQITEIIGIHAQSDRVELQIVIIPGNPGSGLFYIPFIKILSELMNNRADIIVVSHLAHDAISPHKEQLFSLEDQIEHKVDVFKDIVFLENRPPVVIICHSIGSYMIMKALSKLQEMSDKSFVEIKKIFAMFPFFEADFSILRVKKINFISSLYKHIGMVGDIVTSLPICLQRKIFKYASKDQLDPYTIEICCNILSQYTLRQYLYLTSCYVCKKPFDWNILSCIPPKMLTIFACPNDTWFPNSVIKHINTSFPEINIEQHETQIHAFIVSRKQYMHAANIISDVLLHDLNK